MSNARRTLWLNPKLDDYSEGDQLMTDEVLVPCGMDGLAGLEMVEPNLVGSRVAFTDRNPLTSWHSPVIDVDFPVRVVPSSTPGHFHLYFDGVMMRWEKYEPLLKALAEAGIIETGYYENAVRRKMTMVRLSSVRKPPSERPEPVRSWPEGVEAREP